MKLTEIKRETKRITTSAVIQIDFTLKLLESNQHDLEIELKELNKLIRRTKKKLEQIKTNGGN